MGSKPWGLIGTFSKLRKTLGAEPSGLVFREKGVSRFFYRWGCSRPGILLWRPLLLNGG